MNKELEDIEKLAEDYAKDISDDPTDTYYLKSGYKFGYKAAKEKYEQKIKKAINWCEEKGYIGITKPFDKFSHERIGWNNALKEMKSYLQQLKLSEEDKSYKQKYEQAIIKNKSLGEAINTLNMERVTKK